MPLILVRSDHDVCRTKDFNSYKRRWCKMKPWSGEALEIEDDEELERLWDGVKARDILFSMDVANDSVLFTPEEYFLETGYLYDQSLLLDNLFPVPMSEIMEGVFEPDVPCKPRILRALLLKAGFRESATLEMFLARHQ